MTPAELNTFYAQVRKDIKRQREQAKRTLSPAQIRAALKAGKLPANAESLLGTHRDGTPLTLDDLKRFSKETQQAKSRYGKTKGVTIDQLLAGSRKDDIKRANGTYQPKKKGGWIGNLTRGAANLYQVKGNLLFFTVKASADSRKDRHQVKVRLESWNEQLTNDKANERTAVKNALAGRVSIDCDCEHHQYTYRYLAGVAGYAITPPNEKDYPKVRNPQLTGSCCKHVTAAFQKVRTPTYTAFLAAQLKLQRDKAGFADKTRNLTEAEQAQLSRAKPRQTDHDAAIKKIEQALAATLNKQATRDQLAKQIAALKAKKAADQAKIKAQQKRIKDLERQQQEREKALQASAEKALQQLIRDIARTQGITEDQAKALIRGRL